MSDLDWNNIKPEWRAVGVDVTRHFNFKEEDKPYIDRVIDVCFYDRNEHTYLCELTPSYFLRHLYTTVVFKGEPTEEIIDRIDNRYTCQPTDDCYMHVSNVDRLDSIAYGQDATEDEVREYWQGNCPI